MLKRVILGMLFVTSFGFLLGCSQKTTIDVQPQQIAETSLDGFQLISKTSDYSFDDTITRLRANIEKRPLVLFAEVDHAKGAASIDLELAPSMLFIFGNPKGGTPLMVRNPKMGIVLPLKMHVYADGDEVHISYPDMSAVAKSYDLDIAQQPIPNIVKMLEGLAHDVATSEN